MDFFIQFFQHIFNQKFRVIYVNLQTALDFLFYLGIRRTILIPRNRKAPVDVEFRLRCWRSSGASRHCSSLHVLCLSSLFSLNLIPYLIWVQHYLLQHLEIDLTEETLVEELKKLSCLS